MSPYSSLIIHQHSQSLLPQMAKTTSSPIPFFYAYCLLMASVAQDAGGSSGRSELVPAMFVFGDSLVDSGNNNDLPSLAKANYYPYGIDFSAGPTGRFSNGYTIVDELAELLGLPLIPPHSQASGDRMLRGLNYASAAAGILDDTGRNFVGRIPFNKQIANFASTTEQLIVGLGPNSAAQLIRESILFVGMGNNDYLNNYLMPNYKTKCEYNAEQFALLLVSQYTRQLTELYSLGARKFVVASLGPVACIPCIRSQNFLAQCSPKVDNLISLFNENVKLMVNNLNAMLPGAKFIYVDIYHMAIDILLNPGSYGFSVTDRACCGLGRNKGKISCLPFQNPCRNRDQYVFWDAFHPTAAVHTILARRAFNSSTSNVVYPMNIQQLASLQLQQN